MENIVLPLLSQVIEFDTPEALQKRAGGVFAAMMKTVQGEDEEGEGETHKEE